MNVFDIYVTVWDNDNAHNYHRYATQDNLANVVIHESLNFGNTRSIWRIRDISIYETGMDSESIWNTIIDLAKEFQDNEKYSRNNDIRYYISMIADLGKGL